MAAETIQLDPGILVASSTELLFPGSRICPIHRKELAVWILGHVTGDTPGETVISLADTLVHCDVPLMFDQLEMGAPHEGGGCNTGIQIRRLASLDNRINALTLGEHFDAE